MRVPANLRCPASVEWRALGAVVLLSSAIAIAGDATSSAADRAQPFVARGELPAHVFDWSDQTAISVPSRPPVERIELQNYARSTDPCCLLAPGFQFDPAARHGQAVPGGGTLSPIAPANPATINDYGQIAFFAQVVGSTRNQGIFISDGGVLTPVAIGCGGGGGSGNPGTGCGDPAPIGGTFSGFFGGTFFAPAINNRGDVLFMADVYNGSAPRGLFLRLGASGTIVKVAAVGDPSPLGGTLTRIGPGSLNNLGEVAFIATNSGTGAVNILRWNGGVLTKHVAVGDAVPGGGTFAILAGESLGFSDGTTIPVGDLPGINDLGQVGFFSTVGGGPITRGLFVTTAGVHQTYIAAGQATPIGGTYFDFQAPLLNDNGEIAFFADVFLGGGQYTSGWVAGSPGIWRKALAFYDSVGGGQCYGLAFSRNPMRAIDDCGNLAIWTAAHLTSGTELDTQVYSLPDNSLRVVAQEGQTTPLGGTFGGMNAWITVSDARGATLGAYTPGSGVANAQFVVSAGALGDLNGDLTIDLDDLSILLVHFGVTSGATYAQGDLTGDGAIDLDDLSQMLVAFSVTCI